MGKEIEHKFLVAGDGWRPGDEGVLQRQGYLAVEKTHTVRVRIAGGTAKLNVKSAQVGLTRAEYEYPIPLKDAEALLGLCGLVIEKTRYKREFDGHVWEVDVFHGANEGLVTAEVEVKSEQEAFRRPDWAGEDVSRDHRYRVAYLVDHPYREWKDRAPPSSKER
jgi:adenylate cyclase